MDVRTSVGQPTKIYIKVWVDTDSLEDLSGSIDDKRERESGNSVPPAQLDDDCEWMGLTFKKEGF